MRSVALGPIAANAGTDEKLDWCIRSIQEIARASNEDAVKVLDSYAVNAAPAATRMLNVSSPSTSNLAAVLGTLIADLRRRGVKRSG
jgi:hypothetical protein